MKIIKVNTLEELKKELTKSQISYFRDKANNAMDAYEQLTNIRNKCNTEIADKVYGVYILIIYRSIFGNNNNIDDKFKIKLNFKMFIGINDEIKEFKFGYLKKIPIMHEYIIEIANQLYAHTDLNSSHKSIQISEKQIIKGIKRKVKFVASKESILSFKEITDVANFLATVYYCFDNIINNKNYKGCYAKFDREEWIFMSYS